MRFGQIILVASVLLMSSALPASATPKVRRGPTATRLLKAKTAKPRASIEPERATAIQTALIKAGYMTGTPSGAWDAPTQAAMEKLQSDNGWQTKIVPDSRAIIKLGLGPNTPAPVVANVPAGEEREEPAAIAPDLPAPSNK